MEGGEDGSKNRYGWRIRQGVSILHREGRGVVLLSHTFPRKGKSACSSKISGGMYCEAEWLSGHPGAGAGMVGGGGGGLFLSIFNLIPPLCPPPTLW